jgi:hypothetical protein
LAVRGFFGAAGVALLAVALTTGAATGLADDFFAVTMIISPIYWFCAGWRNVPQAYSF